LVDKNIIHIFVEDKNTLTMAIRKTTTLAPKLNVQHNYITLKLPTGNFTTSYVGAKCSGQLVKMKGAFEALDKYVQTASKTKSYGEAMNDLTNPTLLNKLVPGWDKPVIADTFVTGDLVSFTDGMFVKKYPGKFEVTSVKGKYTYIKVINKRTGLTENVGFASTELKKS
jgi:predicted ATP-dependent Lon-type protease